MLWMLSVSLILLSGCGSPAPKPKAVILVLVDTLRPDHINAFGYHKRKTTPELDKLVRDGVAFSNAYSNAPWTVPSVMSLMTSLYPSATGFDREAHLLPVDAPQLSRTVHTLAEFFQAAGFATAAFTADGAVSSKFGFSRGFDVFDEEPPMEGSDLENTLTRALLWLNENQNQRFFLFLHTYEVHLPHTHSEYAPMQPGQEVSDQEKASVGYDSDLMFTDEQLARLWNRLREEGLYNESLIVVLSDHGEELGERVVLGRADDHGYHLYDELLRVPLLLVAPNLIRSRGSKVDAPVQLVDVLPTLLELAGIGLPPVPLQGRSLVPLLRGESLPARPLFAQAPFQGPGWIAVRWGRFKYIAGPVRHVHRGREMWWDRRPGEAVDELYDLVADPGETANVVSQRPDVKAQLLEMAKAMRKSSADIFRLANHSTSSPHSDLELLERLRSLGYIH